MCKGWDMTRGGGLGFEFCPAAHMAHKQLNAVRIGVAEAVWEGGFYCCCCKCSQTQHAATAPSSEDTWAAGRGLGMISPFAMPERMPPFAMPERNLPNTGREQPTRWTPSSSWRRAFERGRQPQQSGSGPSNPRHLLKAKCGRKRTLRSTSTLLAGLEACIGEMRPLVPAKSRAKDNAIVSRANQMEEREMAGEGEGPKRPVGCSQVRQAGGSQLCRPATRGAADALSGGARS